MTRGNTYKGEASFAHVSEQPTQCGGLIPQFSPDGALLLPLASFLGDGTTAGIAIGRTVQVT